MKRKLTSLAAVLAMLSLVTQPAQARPLVPADYLVDTVANSYIRACPSATVGEMADAFFGYPYWSSFTSTTGKRVVELEGDMEYKNRPVTALIQFIVKRNGNFRATYLSFNDIDQSQLMLSALLSKMCDEA